MKRIVILTIILLVCLPAKGQHFDPEHRHAIEISSGIPPVQTFLLGAGISYRVRAGFNEDDLFRGAINIGYTYAINEKWDFNFVFDLTSHFYKRTYYPEKTVTSHGYEMKDYDFSAEPVSVKNGVQVWPSYSADFRWKWYRNDNVRVYTAFGLSYLPWFWPIFPYLTPVGINFGGNHFYGVAELNVSTAASLLLIGAGYRF